MYIHFTNWNRWRLHILTSVPADLLYGFVSRYWKIVIKAKPSFSWWTYSELLVHLNQLPTRLCDFTVSVGLQHCLSVVFLSHLLHQDPNQCKAEVQSRTNINPSQSPSSTFMGNVAYSQVQPENKYIVLCLSSRPWNSDKSSELLLLFRKILCLLPLWYFFFFPQPFYFCFLF